MFGKWLCNVGWFVFSEFLTSFTWGASTFLNSNLLLAIFSVSDVPNKSSSFSSTPEITESSLESSLPERPPLNRAYLSVQSQAVRPYVIKYFTFKSFHIFFLIEFVPDICAIFFHQFHLPSIPRLFTINQILVHFLSTSYGFPAQLPVFSLSVL